MNFSLVFALAATTRTVVSANNPSVDDGKSADSVKDAYMSTLMRHARPTKNSKRFLLEEDGDDGYETIANPGVDMSDYSLRFEKCQFVRTYDDFLAYDDPKTILATKRFVIFRLCPSDACLNNSCDDNFGEYFIDLEEYLKITVRYQKQKQDDICIAQRKCNNNNNLENNLNDCGEYNDYCMKIENMGNFGYFDATNFISCRMIYDPEDDEGAALYAGPMCESYSGEKIKIGVFTDEDCNFPDETKNVEDYILDGDGNEMKLSYHLLRNVYSSNECTSCKELDYNKNNKNEDEREKGFNVNQMCTRLYDAAGKCEKRHGLNDGFINFDQSDNQLAQEDIICDFVQSLQDGTYDESGKIVITGANVFIVDGASIQKGQIFALAFFFFAFLAVATYAAVLCFKIFMGGSCHYQSIKKEEKQTTQNCVELK